jgi:hypothetical protein
VPFVSDRAFTPELALAYLGELSTDIRAAALLDSSGALAASSGVPDGRAGQLGDLLAQLFDEATAAGGEAPSQIEISLPEGVVFAVRENGWTLGVVAGRYALSSLMFYDLRMVIRDLDGVTA